MRKSLLLIILILAATACSRWSEPAICTEEFRMIMVKIITPAKAPVVLDSAYTIRLSTQEVIRHNHTGTPGIYVVLGDAYHSRLKNKEDDFRFVGWRNNQAVINEMFRIASDNCHIHKRSGADSVEIQ